MPGEPNAGDLLFMVAWPEVDAGKKSPEVIDDIIAHLRKSGTLEESIQATLLRYRDGHQWDGTEVERRAYLRQETAYLAKRGIQKPVMPAWMKHGHVLDFSRGATPMTPAQREQEQAAYQEKRRRYDEAVAAYRAQQGKPKTGIWPWSRKT